jgi:ubiquinone biosynthesis protein Coq4
MSELDADAFMAAAQAGPETMAAVEAAAVAAKADPFGAHAARATLAAALAHAAFAAPNRTAAIYDAAAAGWLGPATPPAIPAPDLPALPIPQALWPDFWALVADAAAGKVDALSITTRSAGLGGHFGPAFQDRVAATCLDWPGVREAAAGGIPPKFTLEALARGPDGSVANRFHRLIVENGFDLEVLDRDALGLDALMAPLDYLNVRSLQSHDLWHILGGYHTTALHEIAISGFQLAQFGHSYSAQFLAVTAATAASSPPPGFNFLMDVVLSGWRHGRETPSLLGLDWESHWHLDVETLREKLGMRAYPTPYPPDIIEQTRGLAA